jgi:malate synthase
MTNYTESHNLSISKELKDFVAQEILPGLDISEDHFWDSLSNIFYEYKDENQAFLEIRESIQTQIDEWHKKNKDFSADEYKLFLKSIDYLKDEGPDFSISTSNVDDEIAVIAGPQLVVPVMNARFALNAANARWGSLYDALYGTDMISEADGAERSGAYNPVRGDKVIAFAKQFLDQYFSLDKGSFTDVVGFDIDSQGLNLKLNSNELTKLDQTDQFIGYQGSSNSPTSILLKNNNLHVEIQIDKDHSVGANDPAGIKDVYLESAITTIQDCEDSVAAVDAQDKIQVYRNWLGLMKGDLKESFQKGGKEITRTLNPDRSYFDVQGNEFSVPGRSTMLVRNVGHLMTNPAILDKDGNEIPEGIMDAMFTICIAKHDLIKNSNFCNSRTGSIYIVKPKMHGPEEVAFACRIFEAVEQALMLKPLTVKIGIMDEERRTTVNLKECIRSAQDRVIFINTGFLDRTGDEIHTSMEAGPVVPKAVMKQQAWINAYEDWNVDVGLKCGLQGKAQIGKGMWPMPDEMLEMYQTKIGHPKSGANCAWVPSPTAATLHAMHYHEILVGDQQTEIMKRPHASLADILSIPLLRAEDALTEKVIYEELDNNSQGILGYVVRWVDQGVGCSKVPDINNIGLMEDRATCRISSQHIANWLHHGIINKKDVEASMQKMAAVVDKQNAGDPDYRPMAPDFNGHAFNAALSLALEGRIQPSGYTEPILHSQRLTFKGS